MFPTIAWDSPPTLGWQNLPIAPRDSYFLQFFGIGTLLD
jgi:hypothetical protein